jgi:hypothetical protein
MPVRQQSMCLHLRSCGSAASLLDTLWGTAEVR